MCCRSSTSTPRTSKAHATRPSSRCCSRASRPRAASGKPRSRSRRQGENDRRRLDQAVRAGEPVWLAQVEPRVFLAPLEIALPADGAEGIALPQEAAWLAQERWERLVGQHQVLFDAPLPPLLREPRGFL